MLMQDGVRVSSSDAIAILPPGEIWSQAFSPVAHRLLLYEKNELSPLAVILPCQAPDHFFRALPIHTETHQRAISV